MDTKKWFKVPQRSAVKVVTKRFNHSANPIFIIKFPIRNLFLFTVICFALLMAPMAAPAAMAETAYVEGEVIVGFRSNADDNQIAAFESQNGLTKLKSFPHIRAVHYRIAPGQTTNEAIAILSKEPIVEYAEPNYLMKRQSVPTDPKFPEQWYLSNTGQVVNGLEGTTGIDINWLAANDLFSGSQNIVVAVVDSGVAFDHPEFVGKLWVNPHETIDGIDNDGNGHIDDIIGWDFCDNDKVPLDENNHGTLVASLIAASSGNGEGGVGVSSRVKLMVLRAGNDIGSLPSAAIINAFTYAGNKGANIINASFGSSAYSSSQYAIIQWLGRKGVLVVAAAGNGGSDRSGDNNDITPQYPASYALDNIISVAAIDQKGRLATFSNYGPSSVHIAAPGTNIFGASPTFSTVFADSFGTGGVGWTQGQLPGSLSPYIWSIYVDGFGRHWITDSVDALFKPTNYTANTDSYARTPLISVGLAQLLSYRIWYQLEYLYDWLIVEASSDGGATWTWIDLVTGYSYSSCPSCSIYAGSIRNVDLSHYGLQNKNIYIRFRLVSNGAINYDGVYLDEIMIKEVAPFSYDGTQYRYDSGTSFSSPLVAGVAALIWSQRPDFTYKQVRDAVLGSAKSLEALNGMVASGGMVDAYAALQAAIAAPMGLTLSTKELYFSGQPVGTSSPTQSVTLTNAGTSSINLSQFLISNEFGGTDSCPPTLSAGQACHVDTKISPTSVGERDGYLQIVSDTPGSPHVIRLLGLATAAISVNLTITKSGTGSGTVTSAPVGIDCGSTCSASYDSGTSVTLDASPASGSTFAGWSGSGCSGTGSCSVTMDAAKTVTATFSTNIVVQQYVLTVTKSGTGAGAVSATGLACSGNTCTGSFNSGAQVTLTATPDSGFTFTGWLGSCTGANTACTITMDTSKNVTATFTAATSGETVNLSAGWNFISFPKLPASATVETVFGNVSPNVRIIWGYNNSTKIWKRYKPCAGDNTLETIEGGIGYWAYMDASGNIDISGWDTQSRTVPLSEGWNLTGYNGTDSKTFDSSYISSSGLADKWVVIWTWENGQWYAKHATVTELPVLPLTILNQGRAYWIKIKPGQSADWNQ